MPRLTAEQRLRLFQALHGPILWVLRRLDDPLAIVEDRAGMARDPYGTYERIRAQGRVARSRLPMVVVASGHAAVQQALQQGRVAITGAAVDWDSPLNPSLLSLDPPDHTRIRRLVTQAFTVRSIERMRGRAERVAEDLLDRAVATDGPIDLMRDYASPLPIVLICELLGVPADDLERFRRWGEAVALSLEIPDPRHQRRIDTAAAELQTYFSEHFAARRAEPAGDLLTALVQARDGGDRLTDDELVATSILLLLAGFETTVNLIGNGTLALLHHPDQRERFAADPEGLAPQAVHELLRYDSPVQLTSRVMPADGELDGEPVREGQMVVCLLGGANRDPAVFRDPDALVLDRPNARDHLSFSAGAHYCLGASLARLEGEVALSTLFRRFPKLRQSAPARRRPTQVLRGLQTLPVDLGPPA